jgi:hypothetical protein
MSAGDTPGYRLNYNGWVKEDIKGLYPPCCYGWCPRDGFVQSLQRTETALQTEPDTWGDPIGRLRAMRMTRYRRIYDQFLVRYGVHQDVPEVWVTLIAPVLKNPLRMGEG